MDETPKTGGRRSFIAVPVPMPVRAALFAACAALGQELPGVKWQRKIENLHVTIRFLGNVSDARLRELGAALARRFAGVPPFEVSVRGIGAFPSARRANVIWAGIDDDGGGLGKIAAIAEIAEIADTADTETTGGAGIGKKESRPFRAHLTLGRSKSAVDVRAASARLSDQSFGRFTVDEVHLYESQLGRKGSTYLLLARASLG